MDGFAVRAEDTFGAPVSLQIVATLAAGAAPADEVGPGQAIRIMTGAPMPPGADAVVMVELTSTSPDGATVTVERAASVGEHVRRAGDDVQAGDVVVAEGTVLTPAHLGVLASVGTTEVVAHPRARVGVLSTGDELVEAGHPLLPGQIRDSNRWTLLALVADAGCEPVNIGLIGDDEAAIEAAVVEAIETCDALVTSGGVSMGDFDYVKAVLERRAAGGEGMAWMQVAIRPAKPLAFGLLASGDGGRRVPVFGLPGNPVSSMVSFELFARPGLRRMMGHASLDRPRVQAIADDGLPRRPDGKVAFVRVRCTYEDDGRYHVRSSGGQGSHQLAAMAAANALAILPDGDGAAAGDTVPVMILTAVP
jgi:molybdenum cofactor synthesis domain-containing protein